MKNRKLTNKIRMKAALNVEMALALMAKKKTVRSDKEELFRNALGLRLKTRTRSER